MKKDKRSVELQDDFLPAVQAQGETCKAFYFAFGGCQGAVPGHVVVMGRSEMLRWVEAERGAVYRGFLTGEPSEAARGAEHPAGVLEVEVRSADDWKNGAERLGGT